MKDHSACKAITLKTKDIILKSDIVTPGDYLEIFLSQANEILGDTVDFADVVNNSLDRQVQKLMDYRQNMDGKLLQLESSAHDAEVAIKNQDSEALCRTLEEIKSLRAELIKMQEMAYTDHLTGSHNRRWFTETILDYDGNFKESGLLAVIDLNKFKEINDTYGHAAGDRVLQLIAKNLKNCNGDVIRYGGDEFFVIANGKNADSSMSKILALKKKIDTINVHYGKDTFKIGFSAGFEKFIAGEHFEDIIVKADVKMYSDKKSSKIDCVIIEDE